MKLYYAPGACSLAPHIVLEESGLPFALEKVDLAAKKTETGADFLAVTPKGAVPTLALDDGGTLTETVAILQYVADSALGKLALPAVGGKERYRLLEWLNFIASELHKGFAPLWKPDTPEAYRTIARDHLTRQFGYVDKALASDAFLMGPNPTIADAYLFTVLNWAGYHKLDLTPYPHIRSFMTRMAERPAVRKALQAEGLLKAA